MAKEDKKTYFDNLAKVRLKWKNRNRFYHKSIEKYISFIIPANSRVLEIGCGTGELLNAVKPGYGVGIDFSNNMIEIAKSQFPSLNFEVQDAHEIELTETFDYIILSDIISSLWDVQETFKNVKKISHQHTRIVVSSYNYVWEPILKFAESLRLKKKQPLQNWLSVNDIENIMELEGFEIIKSEQKILLPVKIPFLNFIFNTFLANLPIINHLCLISILVARPRVETTKDYSVSILVPARNERGNIENAILRTPKFGKSQEFIFVEGHSSDGTYEEMLRVKEKFNDKNIVAFKQSGKGKGNAVRDGFDVATGEVLMILDADLTMPPEDLVKYYDALLKNKGEFINGCRLIYPMESEAMRFLNLIANKFFGLFFSYILGQKLKDTLCGTKVLFKKDYIKIIENRSYFGDFDPFGDFDLLFGAAKLNLKIIEVPIRYKDRQYGSTQISRFSHGWLLIKMSIFAAKKIKFR
ncbi:MAG: glycosyltransferase [Bacteroidota bacterium]|nr:glycosyltransferase [Bacteroidota bacterium]